MTYTASSPAIAGSTLIDHAALAAAAAERFDALWKSAGSLEDEELIEPQTDECDRVIDAAIAVALAAPPSADIAALKAKAEILNSALAPDGTAGRDDIRLLVRALVLDVLALGEAAPSQP